MDFSVLEAWFNETMDVYFEDGGQIEGKLMGADEVGLEFEVVRFYKETDEGYKPGNRVEGGPIFAFLPWKNIKLLIRR